METELTKRDTSFNALVPDWWESAEVVAIRQTGYRVLSLTKEAFPAGDFVKIDLTDVRAFLFHGKIPFLDQGAHDVYMHKPGEYTFQASGVLRRESEVGVHLVLIAPVIGTSEDAREVALQHITSATGLLAAFKGHGIVFRHLFDNVIQKDGKVDSRSSMFRFPVERAPDLSAESIAPLCEAAATIAKMAQPERVRVRLSLRWFNAALREQAVHDAFVKFWIAIETLSMPNTTNIRPIFESLARSYGITFAQAKSRFPVGRFFDLRGRIVHEGEVVNLVGAVLGYMNALYFDLISELLGQPHEGRLEEELRSSPLEKTIPERKH